MSEKKSSDSEYENWEAPVTGTDDRLKESGGLPDAQTLKKIHEKCTREYPDKYVAALFDVNISLEEGELEAVDQLIALAESWVSQLKAQLRGYDKFEEYLEEMRGIYGTLGEMGRIIEDSNVTIPTKQLDGARHTIRVPSSMRHVYVWDIMVINTKETVRLYRLKLIHGRMAKSFGQSVKELYRFIKEIGLKKPSDIETKPVKLEQRPEIKALPASHFYESRVNQLTGEELGVKDEEGKFYPFLNGERFALIRGEKEDEDRKPYIILTNDQEIPFDEWVKGLAEKAMERAPWTYDSGSGRIVGTDGKSYDVTELSEETLRSIGFLIRTDTNYPPQWPSDVAERITKQYLLLRRQRRG